MSDKNKEEIEEDIVSIDMDYGAIAVPDPYGNLPANIFNIPQSFPPLIIDQSDEIKALKKEIQELKDMMAEHILLGHRSK